MRAFVVLLWSFSGCVDTLPMPPRAVAARSATTRADPGTTHPRVSHGVIQKKVARVSPLPREVGRAWVERNRKKAEFKDGRWWPKQK